MKKLAQTLLVVASLIAGTIASGEETTVCEGANKAVLIAVNSVEVETTESYGDIDGVAITLTKGDVQILCGADTAYVFIYSDTNLHIVVGDQTSHSI